MDTSETYREKAAIFQSLFSKAGMKGRERKQRGQESSTRAQAKILRSHHHLPIAVTVELCGR
jgi:hypothetical protein